MAIAIVREAASEAPAADALGLEDVLNARPPYELVRLRAAGEEGEGEKGKELRHCG